MQNNARLVSRCKLSLNVPAGKRRPKDLVVLDRLWCTKVRNNDILVAIVAKIRNGVKDDTRFKITVLGVTIGISIVHDKRHITRLYQHALHWTGTKLISMQDRRVQIEWL